MKHNAIAVILMAASTLLAVGCHKEVIEGHGPSTMPEYKVSRIYASSHIVTEMFNPITNKWTTLSERNQERALDYEFTWKGELIEKVYSRIMGSYTLRYDKADRLIHAEGPDPNSSDIHVYDFSYNADGLLARCVFTTKQVDGMIISTRTMDYVWTGGQLQKVDEDEWTLKIDGGTYSSKSTHNFSWAGDNVSSTKRNTIDNDGVTEDTNYEYEYTSLVNPLYGFVLYQDCYNGILWSFEGIDGLSKNLLSRAVRSSGDITYEYTTSGDRVTTISKSSFVGDSTTMRIITDTTYEFEYLD